MSRLEYWRLAVGEKHKYYIAKFTNFEMGGHIKSAWNWSAFFYSIFWLVNRRLPRKFCFLYVALITFLFMLSMELNHPWSVILFIGIYFLAFPVSANYIYYIYINSHYEKIYKLSDLDARRYLEEKFLTERELGRKKMLSMRWNDK